MWKLTKDENRPQEPQSKVPNTGKLSRRPAATWTGLLSSQESLRRCHGPRLRSRGRLHSDGHQKAFSQAWRNLSVRCRAICKPKPTLEHRLPPEAPDASSRTRREERVLLIVPMSSGRLFLDRGARQHCPSPLHRHAQHNSIAGSKGTNYHRTVDCVLTVCLSPGDKRIPGG
jgi:hypothetical protein